MREREQPRTPVCMAELLEQTPVVAAVKDDAGLHRCLACESRIVFLLYGSVNTLAALVDTAKRAEKIVFVHVDLIDGLAAREAAVDYVAQHTGADGIISTKAALLRHAKTCGLATVQRFFVLDSMSLENIPRAEQQGVADCIEILPGLMPKIITALAAQLPCPIIAGGLIREKEDVVTALRAGAAAVSSTNETVWFL